MGDIREGVMREWLNGWYGGRSDERVVEWVVWGKE